MRLLRGTGMIGLGGIPARRVEEGVELIRPLLRIDKPDLITYCESRSIPFFTDSSNAKTDYYRNAVRLDVMPYLQRYNERLGQSLCRLADTASAEADYLSRADGVAVPLAGHFRGVRDVDAQRRFGGSPPRFTKEID